MRKAICVLNLLAAIPAFSQPRPAFEAATIKPSEAAMGSSSWNTHPGSIVSQGNTLKRLIEIAYDLKENQVTGGPKWLDGDRFDINARAAGAEGDPQLLAMLQALLADRFQLAIHREEKIESGYALVPIKAGLKIKPVEPGASNSMNSGNGHIAARGTTMTKLADTLSRIVKNPVFDMTGAQGVFDFQLQWYTEGDATDAISALSTALQDELGLKLELRKVPVDVVVVDKAEKPSAN